MLAKRINILVYTFIILCSTSLYKFSVLGRIQKIAELIGVGVILIVLLLHLVYSENKGIRKHYVFPVSIIILSLLGSMTMAYYTRDQPVIQTVFAQRAIYFYLLYFLLHQLKISVKDLEKIWITLGIVYIILFLVQYFVFPKILFDAYVRSDRGTIRIYLPGSVYLMISFFFSAQYYFRTNRSKYLILLLLIFVIYILTGGRQILATILLVLILFLMFDRQIKSRLIIAFLGLAGVFAGYILFQEIFEGIILESRHDLRQGENYTRFGAVKYYLTDFFKSPIAYITGNGMFFSTSNYGKEIAYNVMIRRFVLGDIGLIGNYAIYGAFFVWGVLYIFYKSLVTSIESRFTYIRLMFITMAISVVIAGGFGQSDTICFTVTMLYVIDVSKSTKSKLSTVSKDEAA